MSINYAEGLSEYPNKGVCGLPEISESLHEIEVKVQQLTHLIRHSKKTVFIVGAGISTVCGIPDFRGPSGVWTLEKKDKESPNKRKQAEGQTSGKKSKAEPVHNIGTEDSSEQSNPVIEVRHETIAESEVSGDRNAVKVESNVITFNQAKPSYTHLAITKLVNEKLVNLIVSQNVDGLFLRTGLSRDHLCEMHGNFFLDECAYCLTR
jgi:mono-ADP-ribosyltransferase sirtuin 6